MFVPHPFSRKRNLLTTHLKGEKKEIEHAQQYSLAIIIALIKLQ